MDTEKMNLFVRVFRDGQLIECTLQVNKTDTIKHVRTMIHRKEGIDPGNQYLIVVNPKEEGLEDNKTLEECHIYDGFNLFLVEVKTPHQLLEVSPNDKTVYRTFDQWDETVDGLEYGPFKIHIKVVYTGEIKSFLVETSDTIKTLKEMIHDKMHIPEDMQGLSTLYRRQLPNNHMTLKECGISFGDTLLLDIGGPIRINIFLIHNQRIVPLEVEILDTCDTVKSKIQDMEGIPASKQWLIVCSTDVDPVGDRTLAKCEISDGDTLYLQTAPMRINVKFYPTNEIICLKVEETETIENVKGKIHVKVGVSSDKLRVSTLPQLLMDERSFNGHRTLADCNICNGDTLLCDFGLIRISSSTTYTSTVSAGLVQISVAMSSGESINLEVSLSDTVSSVKSLIEVKKGFPLNQHALFCEGKQLNDSLLLSNITNIYALYCLPKPRARLQILVKMLNGNTTVLKVKSTKTVGNLVKKILDMEGIPSNQQHKLLLAGKELNHNSTILECSLRWNSLLLLVPK